MVGVVAAVSFLVLGSVQAQGEACVLVGFKDGLGEISLAGSVMCVRV